MLLSPLEINKFKKRLKVILKYYTQEYSENRVGLFDLGYLSIFFELAGKILDSEEHRVLALQVRDRLGRIMLKSFISGEFFRSHGSNIIALEIWKEMKKPCDIFEAYKDLISERYFKRVDEFLVGPGKFELLEGAVGFSMVAKSLQNKAALKRCENYLKENLEQTEKIPAYFCDTSDYDKLHKAEIFPRANLGLAHGQTAVLSHSVFENKVTIAKKLAKGFIKIDQSLNGQSFPTHWPQYPVLLSRRAGRLRSAWCYGDAGIGHSLLLYSQRIKDLKARRLALETLYRGLAKDHWKSTIEDGHFCHGAGGMAQISLRCYQLCKDPELLKLLKFWIKKLDCPFSDLSKHSNVSEENKKGMSALLMGPLGSAFTMISFLSKNDFKWDRIFLLSDPRSK